MAIINSKSIMKLMNSNARCKRDVVKFMFDVYFKQIMCKYRIQNNVIRINTSKIISS